MERNRKSPYTIPQKIPGPNGESQTDDIQISKVGVIEEVYTNNHFNSSSPKENLKPNKSPVTPGNPQTEYEVPNPWAQPPGMYEVPGNKMQTTNHYVL